MATNRTLRCYAEGENTDWQAFCVDLDIAVQGYDFDDVFRSLNDAIELYVETAENLPVTARDELLSRKAPVSTRISYVLKHFWFYVFAKSPARQRHDFVSNRLCQT